MRKTLLLGLLALPLSLAAQEGRRATPREIPFEATTPLRLPHGLYFGEGAGVALNSRGHVFVYTRTGSEGHIVAPRAASLYEFDPQGNFVREIGGNLFSRAWAHSVRIDPQDNIWLVDNGSSLAVKLNPDGELLQVFGRRRESTQALHPPGVAFPHAAPVPPPPGSLPPPARVGYFNEPTDVAFDAQGNAYFSDGYNNSRVAKYNRDGNWVKSWGERGTAPGQFNLPHGIATDHLGRVYVADRSNNRIQVFDGDGAFLRQITWDDIRRQVPVPADYRPQTADFGRLADGSYNSLFPNNVCITPGPNPVLFAQDMIPGRIYKLSLEGEVLGYFGRDGQKVGEFGWIHGMACPTETEIWVAELLTWRVQKLTLQ